MPQELTDPSLSVTEAAASERLATAVDSDWITQAKADGIADDLKAAGERLRASMAERGMTEEDARGRYLRVELRWAWIFRSSNGDGSVSQSGRG